MKKLLKAIFIVTSLLFASCSDGGGDGSGESANVLEGIGNDVIAEINLARTNPSAYAANYIVPYRNSFTTNTSYVKNGITYQTHEGINAVNECITYMQNASPRSALTVKDGLCKAARDHAVSQAPTGQIGHTGPDGSTLASRIHKYGTYSSCGENISYGFTNPRDIVIQLLVDDNVPGRGHRTNIMEPNYTSARACVVSNHSVYGGECVIDFASGYNP